jgi:hypothetical protein
MAIFEKETKGGNEYIALLGHSQDGEETLIAFISPVKGVDPQVLVEKLQSKGLHAEVRTSKGDVVDFDL